MRKKLELGNVNIPGFENPLPSEIAEKLEKKFKEWTASDFAGFRRLLNKNSVEYPDIASIKRLADSTRESIRDFVLLGTGGSSLGGEALIRALKPTLATPHFHFMDNNDPEWFSWLLQNLRPEETFVYVVSKSGKTPETISQFLVIADWLKQKLGNAWKSHIALSTDPEKGDLRALAKKQNFACLDIPPAVGGRFSVLSSVGLFPAAFAGLNVESFLSGARDLAESVEKNPQNTMAKLAYSLANGASTRPITVLMPYSSQLGPFSRWFCQLWGESLGKNGKGLTPYPAIGTTDQHSQMQLYMEGPRDKTILFVKVKKPDAILPLPPMEGTANMPSFQELAGRSMRDLFDAEFHATRDALQKAGVATATIELDCLDEYALGALFYFWELTTLYAGAALEINPFDQPGVEAAKILTKRYLAAIPGK